MLFACSCQHLLNTFPCIQRTEQVLIELDISAIEEYVIIIIPPALCNLSVRTDVKFCIFSVLALGVSLVS